MVIKMILVDIQVPLLDEVYDFELDEETQVWELLGEITALIARKEGILLKEEGNLRLYAMRQDRLLDKNASLRQQAVEAGDRLVLI